MEQHPCYHLPVEIDVWLYKNDMLYAKAQLQRVCRDGLFISTNVMLLSLNSQLEVVFEIKESDEAKRISFPVQVIHRCLDGVGVKFINAVSKDKRSVVSLLAHVTTTSHLESEREIAA